MLSPGSWHKLVPREPVANVRYRLDLYKRARGDRRFQRSFRALCARDILFYVNSFVWQYNPNADSEFGPFVTWDFQDTAFLEILRAIEERRDLLIEKSREMGASWMCLIAMLWMWQFHPYKKFLCMSRNLVTVDSADPDSLFWKIDFMLRHQPGWLKPKYKRLSATPYFGNEENGSTITGTASTGKAGVGGRATAMFIDEMSQIDDGHEVVQRTSDTTRCRIFNGTHLGLDTAFYDLSQRPDMRKLNLHWTQHPDKNKGLYRYDDGNGRVDVLDKGYRFPVDFNFVLDPAPLGGPRPGVRSPWYDDQCVRKGSPRAIAMDLDINPQGSVSQFFDPLKIRHLHNFVREPDWEGDVDYEAETGQPSRLTKSPGGLLKLWVRPDGEGRLPPGHFVIGTDVAVGTGATNSCLSIADAETGEKIGQYQNPNILPEALAPLTVALCRLFRGEYSGALLVWEACGPGIVFGKRVMELGYSNIYYRTWELPHTKQDQTSDKAGWYPRPVEKRQLLEGYRIALYKRSFLNRSADALNECLRFRYSNNGQSVEHSAENTGNDDPTKARTNHADQAIADALACRLVKHLGLIESREKKEQAPQMDPRSIAGRKLLWEHHRRAEANF